MREYYDALAVHVSNWFRRTRRIFRAQIYDTGFSLAVSFVKYEVDFGLSLAIISLISINFVVACILLSGLNAVNNQQVNTVKYRKGVNIRWSF